MGETKEFHPSRTVLETENLSNYFPALKMQGCTEGSKRQNTTIIQRMASVSINDLLWFKLSLACETLTHNVVENDDIEMNSIF